MAKPPRLLVQFLVITLVGGLAVGVCLALLVPGFRQIGAAHTYTAEVGALRDLASGSIVYDASGAEIGRLAAGEGNRVPVDLEDVPKLIQNAVIATEDQSFWTNPGFDVGGSVRALFENLGSGRIEQGGSTITQQLVKKRLLNEEQDVNRKIREMVLAHRLTEKFTKKQILEQYLNTVYFGQGSYGVKSAAERFFGKTNLADVVPAEAALLAAVIRSPGGDNPWDYPERARHRRNLVLEQMADQQYITADEAAFSAALPLGIPADKPAADKRPQDAWVEQAQSILFNDPRLGATREERETKVLEGGLRIHVTKDPAMQAEAEGAVADGLVGAAAGFDASLVAIDPRTGFVRAMVDSRPFSESTFNLAVDGGGEQVGSSFKIVTLATILANGYSPNDFVDGTSPCSVPPFDGSTANAEGSGGIQTVRAATTGSVNCAFVNMSTSVGLAKVAEMATKLGMRPNVDGRQPYDEWSRVLTLTLGVISVTPVEMATIGATIANGGERRDPVYVWKVEDSEGHVIFDESNRPGERVLEPDVAACVADVLHGPLGPGGTAAGLTPRGQDAFGKTGTNDEKITSAFIGATPELSAFVWHGDAESPNNPPSGGQAGFGGERPAHIWNEFMNAALASTDGSTFAAPGPKCNAPGQFIEPQGGRRDRPAPLPQQPLDPTTPTTFPGGILPAITVPQLQPPQISVPQISVPRPNVPNIPDIDR
jgi:penicillin-binding protein 1A